jgi:hypothetical protein
MILSFASKLAGIFNKGKNIILALGFLKEVLLERIENLS